MNRSVLFLSVGALLLVSACAKQEATSPPLSPDTAPPADQAFPPADETTTTPGTMEPGTATPTDPSAIPPADPTATEPSTFPDTSSPPPQQ